jgi:hypothetical protein
MVRGPACLARQRLRRALGASIKYEASYLCAYNSARPHSSLNTKTPHEFGHEHMSRRHIERARRPRVRPPLNDEPSAMRHVRIATGVCLRVPSLRMLSMRGPFVSDP